jgi:hypothetical protein
MFHRPERWVLSCDASICPLPLPSLRLLSACCQPAVSQYAAG